MADSQPPDFFNQDPRDRAITFAGAEPPEPETTNPEVEESLTYYESATSARQVAEKLITSSMNNSMIEQQSGHFK